MGFNFTEQIRDVTHDIVSRLPEMKHIDLSRIAFAFAQARNASRWGTYATLTPMRFRDGQLMTMRRGQPYTVQRLYDRDGREFLYILTFYLPRFMNVDLNEKLVTIVHELWHISPDFNGDIRRHPGRCYAHTHSQREYDEKMQVMVDRWLKRDPPTETYEFLTLNFQQLQEEHGRVMGRQIPHPKMIPFRPSA